MKPLTYSQFRRASRQLLVLAGFAIALIGLVGFAAFGQTVGADPLPAPDVGTTIWGWVFRALVGIAFVVGTLLALKWLTILSEKAKQGGFVGLMAKLGMIAMTSGGVMLTRMRPLFEKDLADGKITPEEWKELLAEGEKIFREVAAKDLLAVLPLLGVSGDGAVSNLIQGLIGNAIRKITGTGPMAAIPMPAPLAEAVAKAAT